LENIGDRYLGELRKHTWKYLCPACKNLATASIDVPTWPIGVRYYSKAIICEHCGTVHNGMVDLGEKRKP